jgi:hypothetical protein
LKRIFPFKKHKKRQLEGNHLLKMYFLTCFFIELPLLLSLKKNSLIFWLKLIFFVKTTAIALMETASPDVEKQGFFAVVFVNREYSGQQD